MESNEPKTVFVAQNNTEATLVKNWLAQEGIDARIFNGEMAGGAFEMIESDPEVIVNVEDYERAIVLVEQMRADLASAPDLSEVSDAEGQFDWPMCPDCDELRGATCNSCNSTSYEFSTELTEQGKQVICLSCNEPCEITYLDQCKFCDHDFTGTATVATHGMESTDSNRVMLLVLGLLGIAGIFLAWLFLNK